MDTFEKQRRIFSIVTVFLFLSVLSLLLLVIIPWIFNYNSPDSVPLQGGIAVSVLLLFHLLAILRILYWIRLTKRMRYIKREIFTWSGIILLMLGLIILDGALAALDGLRIACIGMFICVFSDIAGGVVFFAALFYLKPKKKE